MQEKVKKPTEVLNVEAIQKFFEAKRIPGDSSFENLYGGNYQNDLNLVEDLQIQYNRDTPEESLGRIAEALIHSLLMNGQAGKYITFRGANLYDDFKHGADLVADPKRGSLPARATLDITIYQKDIKGRQRIDTEYGEVRPMGIEKKIERIKRHLDFLASFGSDDARNLLSWIQSGGLHEPRNYANEKMAKDAERVLLLKYYKTPEDSDQPNKPTYVIGGAQSIISIDTMFVNRALQGNQKAMDVVEALSFLEFVTGIHFEQMYLDKLLRTKGQNMNVLFDTHYTKVKAWSRIFEQREISQLVTEYTKKHRTDREFVEQIQYFSSTYAKVLGLEREFSGR